VSDPLVEELAFRLFIIGLLNTKEKGLCGSLCHLCASVVNLFSSNFTTETQSITEFAQRNTLSGRLSAEQNPSSPVANLS